MPRPRRLPFLPCLSCLALAMHACQSPPAIPAVPASSVFAVAYRGEVEALAAAPAIPQQAPRTSSSDNPRLVTVRASLVELPTAVAEQFLPDLLAHEGEPTPADAEAAAPPTPATPGGDPTGSGFGTVPASPAAPAAARTRGLHVLAEPLFRALATLVKDGRATLLAEPEVVCAIGSEATLSAVAETALVQRVTLVPSGATFAFDLGIDAARHGTWLQVAPQLTEAGTLQLGIQLQLRELVQPVPIAATRFGNLHMPAIASQELRALEPIGPRDTLVLGTMSGRQAGLVVLAIVHVIAQDPKTGTWKLP